MFSYLHACMHTNSSQTHHLVSFPTRSSRVLELGTGTGILGMTIAVVAQPACIMLTDGDPLAMDLLNRNLQDENNQHVRKATTVHTHILLWGEHVPSSFIDCCCAHGMWGNDNDKDHVFDAIVAGDVLYKEDLPRLFFETVNQLLSPVGVLWLCHVPRSTVTQEVVTAAAAAASFEWTEVAIPAQTVSMQSHADDINRAKIYRMIRRARR
jgi:predicted nicotinamide N-methyase